MTKTLAASPLRFCVIPCLPDKPIAIAVSGGPDSMALLLMAKEAGRSISALTVDHGLRPESAQEAQQVKAWCAAHGIAHHILNARETLHGRIQESARTLRYRLLTDWCRHHHVHYLLTAHHRGDQAETLFFRLARGSGLRGLSCMAPSSEMHGITLLRPLLEWGKQELTAYLRSHNQPWIEDPSNARMDYTRNAIRAQIATLADAGAIEQRAARLAAFFLHFRRLIDARVDDAMQQHVHITGASAAIDAVAFATLPVVIARELLARLTCLLTGDDHPPRTEKLERLLAWIVAPDAPRRELARLVFEHRKNPGVIVIYPRIRS